MWWEFPNATAASNAQARVCQNMGIPVSADAVTRREIHDRLGLESAEEFVSSFDRPNIRYTVEIKDDPRKQLLAFLRGGEGAATGTRRSDPMTKPVPKRDIPIVI